ncbi:hypothetical protein PMIN06_011693 [Paraphaeosphaeria minitans]
MGIRQLSSRAMSVLHRLLLSLTWITLGALVGQVEAAQICGDVGTHSAKGTTFYMGNFFFKAPSTFPLCADFCKKDYPRCKSFRYSYYSDAGAQYCEFFPEFLETFFISDNTQPYYYYDVDCAFPSYAVAETLTQLTTATIALSTTTSVSVNTTTTTLLSTSTATSTSTRISTSTTTITTTNTALATATRFATSISTSTLLIPTTQRFTALSTSTRLTSVSTLVVPSIQRITIISTIIRPTTQTLVQTIRSTVTAGPNLRNIPASTVYVTVYRTSTIITTFISVSAKVATYTSRTTTTVVQPTYVTQTITTTVTT